MGLMVILSNARIKGLPKSLSKAILRSNQIFEEFGIRVGIRKLFTIAFLDVSYRQHDFQREMLSTRNGISLVNDFLATEVVDLKSYLLLESLTSDTSRVESLRDFFAKNGSDKGNSISLPLLYASIIESITKKPDPITLLEIGLGTNNVDVDSNMGVSGTPGASLRAFRNFLRPLDRVIGADVDSRVLFQSPGLETYFVDQLNRNTLLQLANQVGCLDLVIDDGLHNLEANANTVISFLSKMNSGGFMVVEDISDLPENIMAWQALSVKLHSLNLKSSLVHTESSMVFVIRK
jgi:hypothetical protein